MATGGRRYGLSKTTPPPPLYQSPPCTQNNFIDLTHAPNNNTSQASMITHSSSQPISLLPAPVQPKTLGRRRFIPPRPINQISPTTIPSHIPIQDPTIVSGMPLFPTGAPPLPNAQYSKINRSNHEIANVQPPSLRFPIHGDTTKSNNQKNQEVISLLSPPSHENEPPRVTELLESLSSKFDLPQYNKKPIQNFQTPHTTQATHTTHITQPFISFEKAEMLGNSQPSRSANLSREKLYSPTSNENSRYRSPSPDSRNRSRRGPSSPSPIRDRYRCRSRSPKRDYKHSSHPYHRSSRHSSSRRSPSPRRRSPSPPPRPNSPRHTISTISHPLFSSEIPSLHPASNESASQANKIFTTDDRIHPERLKMLLEAEQSPSPANTVQSRVTSQTPRVYQQFKPPTQSSNLLTPKKPMMPFYQAPSALQTNNHSKKKSKKGKAVELGGYYYLCLYKKANTGRRAFEDGYLEIKGNGKALLYSLNGKRLAENFGLEIKGEPKGTGRIKQLEAGNVIILEMWEAEITESISENEFKLGIEVPLSGRKKKMKQIFENPPALEPVGVGHKLLMKMGWKAGSALQKNGIIDPIPIQITDGCTGLGYVDTKPKNKKKKKKKK